MKKDKDKFSAAYDAAGSGAAPAAPDASDPNAFSQAYDATSPDGGDGSQAADPDSGGDLDISASDVSKMQQLKASGDMAALGQYVAQLLQ